MAAMGPRVKGSFLGSHPTAAERFVLLNATASKAAFLAAVKPFYRGVCADLELPYAP